MCETQNFSVQLLLSEDPKVKYPAGKMVVALSKENPAALYQHFDLFVSFLKGEKNVMKWVALQVIANLVRIDTEDKSLAVLPLIIELFHSDSLITSSNAVLALTEIALHKPSKRDQVLAELISVEKNNYVSKGKHSPECRNIAIGHVLDALAKFDKEDQNRIDVQKFIKRQCQNSRSSVQRTAEALVS